MFDFEYHLKNLPDKPGVYMMKNSLGEVIYVGKAKILKNRVKSYFQNSKNHSEKVRVMVKNISEFEYIVTDSEMEALILECNLIKKYSPKYNILLKDDKFYPFIKITIKDDFIKLGQALKLAGLVDSGVDAKFVIQDGQVKVNGEVDTRRGKKLYAGDTFEFEGTVVTVK